MHPDWKRLPNTHDSADIDYVQQCAQEEHQQACTRNASALRMQLQVLLPALLYIWNVEQSAEYFQCKEDGSEAELSQGNLDMEEIEIKFISSQVEARSF